MHLRALRHAVPVRAAVVASSILAVGGVAAFAASPALAATTPVPISSSTLALSASASAPHADLPAGISITLSTPSSSTLVDPEAMDLYLPSDFSTNPLLAGYLTSEFGGVGSTTYSAVATSASTGKSIGTASITSSDLTADHLPDPLTGKVYVVDNDTNSTFGDGLDLGTEVQFSLGSGEYLDFLGDVDRATQGVYIDFADLALPATLGGEPVPFSSFTIGMPASSSVSITPKCGAVSPVTADVADALASGAVTDFSAPVSVLCAPKLSAGKFADLKKGKPTLSFTAAANGGDYSSLTVALPKGLSFHKATKKDVKVTGATVTKVSTVKGDLVITFKSAASKAKVTISKAIKETSSLEKKVKDHKTKSLSVKVTGGGETASLTIKKLS